MNTTHHFGPVHGHCTPGYEPLHDVFAASFSEAWPAGELGAAICVYVKGREVLSLWGGWQDLERTGAWREDTLCLGFSATKGMAALVIHHLAERGKLDIDAPVAAYWPAFASEGKADVQIQHVLTHRAGLHVLRDDALGVGLEQDMWARELERAPLRFEPGARCQYHSISQGFLLAELVRRVDGRSMGRYLREEIAEPLNAEVALGLQDNELPRCASFYEAPGEELAPAAAVAEPAGIWYGARQMGLPPLNARAWRVAEIPASNGHFTARGLARVYAALANGGELEGVRLLKPETIERMSRLVSDEAEVFTGMHWPLSLGFFKSCDFAYMGGSKLAFGHPGRGGCTGFADPATGLSFGYVLNGLPKAQANVGAGNRARRLVSALASCVGS